jgi:hypothetical protein
MGKTKQDLESIANQKSNYEAWLDLKPSLEQNEKLLDKIYQIMSNKGQDYKLGSGNMHAAYELLPLNYNNQIETTGLRVAILNQGPQHMQGQVISYDLQDLKREISRIHEARDEIINGLYETQSTNQIHPLSNAGIVALHTKNKKGEQITKYAILTEDLSQGRKLNVTTEDADETAIITNKEGEFVREVFIDPARGAKDLSIADKYLDVDAMLHIYR